MKTRKWHRRMGLVMLAPFIGWAITGSIFSLKPGYAGAYEILQPRTYRLANDISVKPDPRWLEFRYLKTILGDHLLVRTAEGWSQLNPSDLIPKNPPEEDEIRLLVEDAIANNTARYGHINHVTGNQVITDTGVRITVDWGRMSFQQRGPDTDRIDALYRIHYLQWTGVSAIDKVLGLLGIILVIALSALGVRLFFGSKGIAA
jgi:hypothetical protein